MQLTSERAPLVVTDLEQAPGQRRALLGRFLEPLGSPMALPIIASSMVRKRGRGVRYCPRAIRCKAVTIERAGASVCAIASEASSAIAADIKSATSITLRMYSQASKIAAA
jgi:hypothetical protein